MAEFKFNDPSPEPERAKRELDLVTTEIVAEETTQALLLFFRDKLADFTTETVNPDELEGLSGAELDAYVLETSRRHRANNRDSLIYTRGVTDAMKVVSSSLNALIKEARSTEADDPDLDT